MFGSFKNKKIVRSNASERILELNDSNISIFNKQCHPFLEAALISIGAFIKNDDTQINYSDIYFKFYGISQVPNDQIIKEIYEISKKIKSKFKITYSPKVSIDKLNFFCLNTRVTLLKYMMCWLKKCFLRLDIPPLIIDGLQYSNLKTLELRNRSMIDLTN